MDEKKRGVLDVLIEEFTLEQIVAKLLIVYDATQIREAVSNKANADYYVIRHRAEKLLEGA